MFLRASMLFITGCCLLLGACDRGSRNRFLPQTEPVEFSLEPDTYYLGQQQLVLSSRTEDAEISYEITVLGNSELTSGVIQNGGKIDISDVVSVEATAQAANFRASEKRNIDLFVLRSLGMVSQLGNRTGWVASPDFPGHTIGKDLWIVLHAVNHNCEQRAGSMIPSTGRISLRFQDESGAEVRLPIQCMNMNRGTINQARYDATNHTLSFVGFSNFVRDTTPGNLVLTGFSVTSSPTPSPFDHTIIFTDRITVPVLEVFEYTGFLDATDLFGLLPGVLIRTSHTPSAPGELISIEVRVSDDEPSALEYRWDLDGDGVFESQFANPSTPFTISRTATEDDFSASRITTLLEVRDNKDNLTIQRRHDIEL